jgi:hypothetical protein
MQVQHLDGRGQAGKSQSSSPRGEAFQPIGRLQLVSLHLLEVWNTLKRRVCDGLARGDGTSTSGPHTRAQPALPLTAGRQPAVRRRQDPTT